MIVIPMAGSGARFRAAGYATPKYRLPLHGATLFDHAVGSFKAYFATEPFLFVLREEAGASAFVEARTLELGVAAARLVVLAHATRGQAESVALGLRAAGVDDAEPVTVFNIDTFRPGFRRPDAAWASTSDGYLEAAPATDPGLSYVEPLAGAREPLVARTAEKQVISPYGSTGLYHFARAGRFFEAFAAEEAAPSAAELYVAPLYNHLIARGARIYFVLVAPKDNIVCGTPEQYQALLSGPAPPG